MPKCFSLTASRSWCYRTHFSNSGLRSTITDLGDGTVMHCWVPKTRIDSKPDLLLVHGFGANAMWQWGDVVRLMVPHFNVYVPDLVFFGDSYTTRPDRSESFQEKDLGEGMFRVSDLEEVGRILVPQTADKMRELMSYTFVKPPKIGATTSFIPFEQISFASHAAYTHSLGRRRSSIPLRTRLQTKKVKYASTYSQLLFVSSELISLYLLHHKWCDFGFYICRHLGDNAQLVIVKKSGHAFIVEKPKELFKHLKSFLIDSFRPTVIPLPNQQNQILAN
ncbi:hypothetical protein C3L33_10683, partial [Rhododendron williamsianum]